MNIKSNLNETFKCFTILKLHKLLMLSKKLPLCSPEVSFWIAFTIMNFLFFHQKIWLLLRQKYSMHFWNTIIVMNLLLKFYQKSTQPKKKSVDHIRLITAVRAMNDYCLNPKDLTDLPHQVRRSPYIGEPPCIMYLESDVIARAVNVHGSIEALQKKQFIRTSSNFQSKERRGLMTISSSHVVFTAIAVNFINCSLKFFLWIHTGSHSLFAESIHSLADTLNQIILAFGIYHSVRKPDTMHPYGYSNAKYVASLVSGVGIFCFGTGLSFYHGVQGILHPQPLEFLQWAFPLLGISFISEGGTFILAWRELRQKARMENMTVTNYVLSSEEPSLSVIFLEDLAAILGVGVAATCMGMSVYFNNPLPDAVGSLIIGSLLGAVATLIIKANANHLVGRSIPQEEILQIVNGLEEDVMIRAIHDIKATKLGTNKVRFKAEIDFDGRNVTRAYLETLDLKKLLQEVHLLQTEGELENFLLEHGEQVIDRLGAEIDRIEQELKKNFPEIRHVDLEVL
ncbi:Proton-coupled zinc antiporter SLC30A9 [Trichinella spiralis]|uniref:Proton-coupled zinc antiporter SLC30A9, mitochondrial n=1 Tax=Trichinella spiralis TaxID=6334 RepID=A0ABR3KJW6_TRISP